MSALLGALQELAPVEASIHVVTTLPNRYASYTEPAEVHEACSGTEIDRIPLPSHRSSMSGQARAFSTFARRALATVGPRDYDLVFATSSRLMTASLGAYISRRKKCPLYLDIRDIFLDTMVNLLPDVAAVPARPILSCLESWTLGRAKKVNLVSRGFEPYFVKRYPHQSFSWFTNGIDDEFIAAAPRSVKCVSAKGPITVLYAGNIGEGQGLHHILPGLARALGDRVRFLVIGDGGRRGALKAALAESGIENVELRAPMRRDQLLEAYLDADVLFLHLGAFEAFKKVLPSKVFEYGALGKPILAGVAGYAAEFLDAEIENSAVFTPCDIEGGVRAFEALDLSDRPRPEFVRRYSRTSIMRKMAADVLSLLK